MTQDPAILLIAKPGYLRDSLVVLLTALSKSLPVILVSNWPAETRSALRCYPVLVMVVLEPGSTGVEVNDMVAKIKNHWPHIHLVALVDSEGQRQAASAAGVDRVWLKGTLAAHMLGEIESLLTG